MIQAAAVDMTINLGDGAACKREEKALKRTIGPIALTSKSFRMVEGLSFAIGTIPE